MFYSKDILDPYLDSFSRLAGEEIPRQFPLPDMLDAEKLENELLDLFFPGDIRTSVFKDVIAMRLERTLLLLSDMIERAIRYENPALSEDECRKMAEDAATKLAKQLPRIREMLKLDAQAGFNGDPAAKSVHEIILCYPAIRALTTHRTAHYLYTIGIPLVPRMMNEVIHSFTGIDIHPGAEIGESFFIDHGTGVVIGETTVIGNRVKLYQGVTLGALSIPKKGCGALLEGVKRHPTIEDNVTIYANSTILGDITIGHDTIIASNAWIKEDIPPESMVTTGRLEIKVRPIRRDR